jgi:hypothetical protein
MSLSETSDHTDIDRYHHYVIVRKTTMRTKAIEQSLLVLFTVTCALGLMVTGPARAAEMWVDEIVNMVNFEKAGSPQTNFDPYVQQLGKIRNGVNRGDQQIAKVETDRFLKMLQERTYGLNEVVADELYNFTQSVRPPDQGTSTAAIELGIEHERSMSVPEHTIQTPYEGGPPCRSAEGCDYWLDDTYDPGAAG